MKFSNIIRKFLPEKRVLWANELRTQYTGMGRARAMLRANVVLPSSGKSPLLDYTRQARKLFRVMQATVEKGYVYPLDRYSLRVLPGGKNTITSTTPDFGKILDSDLNRIKAEIEGQEPSEFRTSLRELTAGIERLAERFRVCLRKQGGRGAELAEYFPAMLYRRPRSFDEAIQKLLFYNALFWQMQHKHVGLGRLDQIFYPYYRKDLADKKLTRAEAKEKLVAFCELLHRDVRFKSLSIIGDTGQYILLGGKDETGANVENEITELFLEIFDTHPFADPKLILRVNDSTSENIWRLAVRSICRGSGSPLLMNETVIMDGMKAFGYEEKDLAALGTSACWEPLIIGKSFDQNNPFRSASALKAVSDTLGVAGLDSFEAFMERFRTEFDKEIRSAVRESMDFDCSPLYSLFFDNCIAAGRDFACGGAKYSWHGAQIVGLPNAVNALLNIKKYVYDERLFTAARLREALEADFAGSEDIRRLLQSGARKFGMCHEEVTELTDTVMRMASVSVARLSCNGSRLKVGFSSPNYIWQGKQLGATPDGRKKGEPLAVHISPVSSEIDISEILDFAGSLDYSGNRLNGNVVDFIVPPAYVRNQDKLVRLLRGAFRKGVYELQLNILDRDTLVDAKAHPEKYPDLIVRVWGFSAYFNELPEAYKDNLIARAEKYEC